MLRDDLARPRHRGALLLAPASVLLLDEPHEVGLAAPTLRHDVVLSKVEALLRVRMTDVVEVLAQIALRECKSYLRSLCLFRCASCNLLLHHCVRGAFLLEALPRLCRDLQDSGLQLRAGG